MQADIERTPIAYRFRTAEPGDDAALRAEIGTTLAHPDHQGRRESYRGAASRGDLLVLERYDRQQHTYHVAGFIECHMRVDDNLSIRDLGTHGDEPQVGVVRYLLDQAFNSFRPAGAQVKVRRDATRWLEILRGIPGFFVEGEEYRRPHYWTIWRWDRERARTEERQVRQPQPPAAGPRPPGPRPPAPRPQAGPGPRRDQPSQRPGGAAQRPGGPAQRSGGPGPRPQPDLAGPGGPKPGPGGGPKPGPGARPQRGPGAGPQPGPAPDRDIRRGPPSSGGPSPPRDARRGPPPGGPRRPQRRPGPARPR